MHGVFFQFLGLDLVVSIFVDFSEHGIYVLISDWEVDLVGLEEQTQEFS